MKDTRFRSAFAAGAVTPEDVLDFHRHAFGLARMDERQGAGNGGGEGGDTPPERPDGVSEEEWNALADPGKRAIIRERERATRAEQEAAALRASRTPKPGPPKDDKGGQDGAQPPAGGQQQPEPTDIAAIVQQAVAAAIQPFHEAQQQTAADAAARKVAETVTTAAAAKLHDPSDALVQLDLTTLTDGSGQPDATKITAALDDLVQRKPHLAKVVDDSRRPGAGHSLGGAAAPIVSEDDRVKAALAKMQAAAGVKLAGA